MRLHTKKRITALQTAGSSLVSTLMLTGVILLGVAATKLLSKTLLKGIPSSFTLELPSYRKPQIGSVIVRSVFDRTLFVLVRAIAAPTGLIIWLAANINVVQPEMDCSRRGTSDSHRHRPLYADGGCLQAHLLTFSAQKNRAASEKLTQPCDIMMNLIF